MPPPGTIPVMPIIIFDDIGKTLVATFLEASGFQVLDLGRDVPLEDFVEAAASESARLIGLSALLTTTMPGQAEVVRMCDERGLRPAVAVLVGGAPVTRAYADSIGADGFAANAVDAVAEARRLTAGGLGARRGAVRAGKREPIGRLLQRQVVHLDGAMGSSLIARGLPMGACPEIWNVERPSEVLGVHAAYVAAGSDVVQTNTFGANPLALERHGLADRLVEINRTAVELARKAAGAERLRITMTYTASNQTRSRRRHNERRAHGHAADPSVEQRQRL